MAEVVAKSWAVREGVRGVSFTSAGVSYLAAQILCHNLMSIADAQDGYTCCENSFIRRRCIFCIHAVRSSGQDKSLRLFGHNLF